MRKVQEPKGELGLGLLGDTAEQGSATPTGSATEAVLEASTNRPDDAPDLQFLEGRAISAAGLRMFTHAKVTRDVKVRATAAAIPYLEAQLERYRREVRELSSAAEGDSAEAAVAANRKLINAKRWVGWLSTDLAERKAKPYATARDVHRYIIKPDTDERQCRYCELPGLASEMDDAGSWTEWPQVCMETHRRAHLTMLWRGKTTVRQPCCCSAHISTALMRGPWP